MNKDKIEIMLRKLGVEPVDRDIIHGREVFIGDGFSKAPHLPYMVKGALSSGQFPKGCFVTWWFVTKGEDHLDRGAPVFFDPDHDATKWHDESTLQLGRINAAKTAAKNWIEKEYKIEGRAKNRDEQWKDLLNKMEATENG